MRAIILAAGLGTRLRPLTNDKPKALVPFKGVPMVERVIRNLSEAGIGEIMVNVHHFGEMVIDFLENLDLQGVDIRISDERETLMDTGGALLHAREFLGKDEYFIVHNVDIVTNLDLKALFDAHRNGGALATMAVKKRPTSRSLLFSSDGFLSGWKHNETGERRIVRRDAGELEDYGNSCIQVINREFLDFFPETRALNLTNMYLDLAPEHRIQAFVHNEDYWFDLGRYSKFRIADKEVF